MANRTVALDRRAISAIAARPAVVAEFPIFARTRPSNCCGAKKATPDVAAIVSAVSTMTDAAKARLKELLGASDVVLYLPTGGTVRL